jgi:hypothetical protein
MRLLETKIGVVIGRLFVLAFGLWLGGAGCLFCCQADDASAPGASTSKLAAQLSMPAAHACCKARRAPLTSVGERSNAADSFAVRRASDTARHACAHDTLLLANTAYKPRPTERPAATLTNRPMPSAHVAAFGRAPVARSRLPDDSDTYLRLAVFLI